MTKKLFLAAASVAALSFAGAAQAGSISGYFGTDVTGNKFSAATGSGSTAVAAVTYQIASERNVTAAAPVTGTMVATNTLTTPIVIGSGAATRDYLVEFTINGATVASTGLALATGPTALPTAATLVSNNNGVVTFLVSVPGGSTVESFSLSANVSQSAKNPITVASTVTAVIGGSNIVVDTASSTVASTYSPYLKPISATSNSLTAELATTPGGDDYVTIAGSGTAELASDFQVVNTGEYNTDLAGTDATPANVLGAATLTVRGPVINSDVTVNFDPVTGTAAATSPANTSVRNLTAGQAQAFAAGSTDLDITNNGADEFVAGTYTVTWAPTLQTGFTAPAASTTDAGTIELEGTNFTAPWVSGTGLATSVIRVSNSNSSASAPVTIRMISGTQVVNGVATPFVSTAAPLVLSGVPANGDLQVTSAQLVAQFGNFTRADFRVTINQEDTGLVAKLRNTRDGQTFEQSLAD